MKALETVYNGYRFRSRLEARWAVFFDAAGIRYQYELEGFEMSSGETYLPDFYLPQFNIFAEIKASRELDDGKASQFAQDFCGYSVKHSGFGGILVCYGDPYAEDMRFISNCETDVYGEGEYDTDQERVQPVFVVNDTTGAVMLLIQDEKPELDFRTAYYVTGIYWKPKQISRFKIKVAATKARQARFEHGEHGG